MALQIATKNRNPKGIPEELALDPETSLTGILASNYGYCNAVPLGPYPGSRNTKIIIDVPQEFISFKDSYLEFQITGSAGNTAGLVASFVPDIRSIISRLTIQYGSKTICDIIGYNYLQNILNLTMDPLWQTYNGSVLVASDPTQANRQTYFLQPGKVYSCKLGFIEGIESIFQKAFPFQKIGSAMQLQVWLDDPQNVISTSAAVTGTVAPSYVVNQVEFHYVASVPSPEWNQMFDSKIQNNNWGGGITFSYRLFDYQLDTSLLSSAVTSASKFLTYKYSSILGIIVAFQPSALAGTWTADNKLNYFYNPGVNVLRLKVGQNYYPQENLTSDSDTFGRFLLMFGISAEKPIQAGQYWNYNGATPANASYVATMPVMKFPDYVRSDARQTCDGLETAISTNMQIDLGFSTATPSTGLAMYIWCYYNATITMNPNGSITLNT